MKTEANFPGVTVIRLTALANAAEALLRMVETMGIEDESAAILADEGIDYAAVRRNCRIAIAVARGADQPLPAELFKDTADRSAVRLVESIFGLTP